ncbi:hypothetical protein ELS18_14680, partial [Clostridium perfringens]
MENLNLNQLENINGGDWRKTASALGRAGTIAGGGILTGIGAASTIAGVVTLNPGLIAGGSAMLGGGIDALSSA